MNNFWIKLKKDKGTIKGLAPMDGITDGAFRFAVAKYGKPDVVFTEFVAVDGICAGAEKVLEGFIFDESERPIVAQIFGANPDNFYKVAPFLCELGFDGIDINMGCPDKSIMRFGGGGSLIGNPKLAAEIVQATKNGINDWVAGKEVEDFGLPENIVAYCEINKNKKIRREAVPVSVKTRIGMRTDTITEWAKYLSEMDLANVTIHGRTLKQMYSGVSDWEAIAKGAEIIKNKNSDVTVIGNGDIKTIDQGKEMTKIYGVDGFLIGRAAMGDPFIFSGQQVDVREKLMAAIEHAKYYEKIFKDRSFINIRKHLVWYVRGFEGASEVRSRLMKADNAKECEKIILETVEKL